MLSEEKLNPRQSELFEGDVCICNDCRELRDKLVPSVGRKIRAARSLAFVPCIPVQRARGRKGNWEIWK